MNPLLIRRRGMMERTSPILPPGYTLVPSVYGRRNGAKFVIIPTPYATAEIYIEARKTEFVNYAPYFGNYTSESANCIRLIANTDDTGFYANVDNKASNAVSNNAGSVLDWHTFYLRMSGNDLLLTIDGVTTTRINVEKGTSNSGAVYLNANNGVAHVATDSTYYRRVIVSYDGVVYRDYYPCVNQSNVVGFYDVKRNVFETSVNSNYPFYVGN